MTHQRFSKAILDIACDRAADEISAFINDQVFNKFRRRGAVVGLSGGIDSAVTASLAVKALGAERVLGLIMPEQESNPVSEPYGITLATALNIAYERVDLTPVLRSLNCYESKEKLIQTLFPGYRSATHKYKIVLPQNLLEKDRLNYYTLIIADSAGQQQTARLSPQAFFTILAANDMKQRSRMLTLYYFAEKNNYIVAGTTNRSEMLQGFFVKYGDGGVDIEPIAHLYKTQVFQLGRYLRVPQEIINRMPSPDTYNLEVSDKELYFCLPYDLLDLLLYAWENALPLNEAARVLQLDEGKVERAFKDFNMKKAATWHTRQMPPSLFELPAGGAL